jgi:hypothetical protein
MCAANRHIYTGAGSHCNTEIRRANANATGAVDAVLQKYALLSAKQWTTVLGGLAKERDAGRAVLVLRWMEANDAGANHIHFGTVVTAYGRNGDLDQAENTRRPNPKLGKNRLTAHAPTGLQRGITMHDNACNFGARNS